MDDLTDQYYRDIAKMRMFSITLEFVTGIVLGIVLTLLVILLFFL